MQLIQTDSVYSYILTESEWYAGTVQQKEAWVNEVLRKAGEANARFASILVNPDAVLSISEKPERHTVWKHTFPVDAEDAFEAKLQEVRAKYLNSLGPSRMAYISRAVFKG